MFLRYFFFRYNNFCCWCVWNCNWKCVLNKRFNENHSMSLFSVVSFFSIYGNTYVKDIIILYSDEQSEKNYIKTSRNSRSLRSRKRFLGCLNTFKINKYSLLMFDLLLYCCSWTSYFIFFLFSIRKGSFKSR